MDVKTERNWVVFCHLSGLLFISFLDLIIPLAIWLFKKSESPFIDEQGKEIVNFHISVAIYVCVLAAISLITFGIGAIVAIPAMLVLVVITIVSAIKGAIRASNGEKYLYPINLRLLK